MRMVSWHCTSDTRFKTRALVVWARARYLSITEAVRNIESLRVSGEETFCFFSLKNGVQTRDIQRSKAGNFTHCTRAPALGLSQQWEITQLNNLRHWPVFRGGSRNKSDSVPTINNYYILYISYGLLLPEQSVPVGTRGTFGLVVGRWWQHDHTVIFGF